MSAVPKWESARRARLSPSAEVVLSGAGRAILMRGKDLFALDDREMKVLVLGWLAYERARRPEAFDALIAPVLSENGSTASE